MTKAKIILVLLLSSSLSSWAQIKSVLEEYRTASGGWTENIAKADYVRFIEPPEKEAQDNLYTIKEYYLNGKIKLLAKSKTQFHYIFQGPYLEFFSSGHKKSIKNYENGKLTGSITEYYPNGKIYTIKEYNEQDQLMLVECRDTIDNVLAHDGNGQWIVWDQIFKKIIAKGKIENGLKDGEWNGNTGDSIKYVNKYAKGVFITGTRIDKDGKTSTYSKAETEAELKGNENLLAFISKNCVYPSIAKQYNIQGRVVVTFIVNADGSLTDFEIVNGIGSGCDQAAINVLKKSSPWLPATQEGIPISMRYTVPIDFTLPNN
jgi:TonB family protein